MMRAPDDITSVLVVEDDYMVLEILVTIFGKAGLQVHAASSGEAALTLMRELGSSIDWLFTDVNLPGLVDGWSVAQEYRLSHPTRPIIYASTGIHRPSRSVEGSIFVEKPVNPAEILRLAQMMDGALVARDVTPIEQGCRRDAA